MLTLAGCLCIMTACVVGAIEIRRGMWRRINELLAWLAAVRLLQNEISYGLMPLPELCSLVGQRIKGTVGEFWAKIADFDGGELSAVWAETMAAASSEWNLRADDLAVLGELGSGLGASGIANQKRLLALTEERLLYQLDVARGEDARWGRLVLGVGWCGGLMLVCMLA